MRKGGAYRGRDIVLARRSDRKHDGFRPESLELPARQADDDTEALNNVVILDVEWTISDINHLRLSHDRAQVVARD